MVKQMKEAKYIGDDILSNWIHRGDTVLVLRKGKVKCVVRDMFGNEVLVETSLLKSNAPKTHSNEQ